MTNTLPLEQGIPGLAAASMFVYLASGEMRTVQAVRRMRVLSRKIIFDCADGTSTELHRDDVVLCSRVETSLPAFA